MNSFVAKWPPPISKTTYIQLNFEKPQTIHNELRLNIYQKICVRKSPVNARSKNRSGLNYKASTTGPLPKKGDQEWTLNEEKDKIPLAILCPSLKLPESMTFEDYVNIGSNVQTDEQLTETQIQIKLQNRLMGDLEEEVTEEANTIQPNFYSPADESCYSIFFHTKL